MTDERHFDDLVLAEGWDIVEDMDTPWIIAMGERVAYAHPFAVYAKLYRSTGNPEIKYQCLRSMHRFAWPEYEKTWNYWDERRLRAYCDGYTYIAYAGGASTGKSDFAGRFALLFFMSAPHLRTVLVASTTLQALSTRIWGYITRFANQMQIPFPLYAFSGNAPKILYDRKDPIHGMYALAAGKGTDEKAISNWIGRHPKEAMLMVLDEATDLDPVLLKSLPNLESGGIEFTCMVIGNSSSRFDLHGCLSTPAGGWKSVDPKTDVSWPTTQKNGICLYFGPYESPAIHEADPEKQARLAKFLVTSEQIKLKKEKYGEKSDGFWRFVLGFWRADSENETIISQKFLDSMHVRNAAEWSGLHVLHVVAGLDPAFSSGGDQCILRLAVLGQSINGHVLLDFRGEQLLYRIRIDPQDDRSAELQIADKVLEVLNEFGIPLSNLAVDSNGQGRALSEVIRLRGKSLDHPLKIYSTKQGNKVQKSFDVIVKTNYELWYEFRRFIQTDQIRGLDLVALQQLTARLVESKGGKQALESKQDYKIRMGTVQASLAHSPDEADAASLALQVAILKYGFEPGKIVSIPQVNSFENEKMWAMQMNKRAETKQQSAPRFSADYSGSIDTFSKVKLPYL